MASHVLSLLIPDLTYGFSVPLTLPLTPDCDVVRDEEMSAGITSSLSLSLLSSSIS